MEPRIFKNKKDLIKKLVHPTDEVLDVGFWGQGTGPSSANWPHRLLQKSAKNVFGVDLDYDEKFIEDREKYKRLNAENFDFERNFDVIFAGDLIEHLSNPGLFLDSCKKHLSEDGRLIITTPNAFNLFNLAEKLSKPEPTVNKDHTMYFNTKTLKVLLEKNGWDILSIDYLYRLDTTHKESWKKKILNSFYYVASLLTTKYVETLVVVAQQDQINK